MSAVDAILAVAGHKSTILFVTGLLHLALFGVRRSAEPGIKRLETPLSAALFPVGILQTVAFYSYLVELAIGGRGTVFSPYFQVFQGGMVPALATVVTGFTMAAAGFSATSQLGRKLPWSVMAGGGMAAVTGGSIYYVASGAGAGGAVVLGGSALIAIIMFMVGYWLTAPWASLFKSLGNYTAFSPVILLTSLGATMLGLISGMGLVVL